MAGITAIYSHGTMLALNLGNYNANMTRFGQEERRGLFFSDWFFSA
jgi:hypothetical protein